MKNLKIVKVYYRNNTTRYKIVHENKIPRFSSNVTAMECRTIPSLVAKHIVVNKNLPRKYYEIIWKLSYPKQLLHQFKWRLKQTKAIKHNIIEFYKKLTTKDYIISEYHFMSTDTGELLKDWKEVLEDMWCYIKHGSFPPIYVYNPAKFVFN